MVNLGMITIRIKLWVRSKIMVFRRKPKSAHKDSIPNRPSNLFINDFDMISHFHESKSKLPVHIQNLKEKKSLELTLNRNQPKIVETRNCLKILKIRLKFIPYNFKL